MMTEARSLHMRETGRPPSLRPRARSLGRARLGGLRQTVPIPSRSATLTQKNTGGGRASRIAGGNPAGHEAQVKLPGEARRIWLIAEAVVPFGCVVEKNGNG